MYFFWFLDFFKIKLNYPNLSSKDLEEVLLSIGNIGMYRCEGYHYGFKTVYTKIEHKNQS